MSVVIRGPQRLDLGHVEAWLWRVDVDEIPHLVTWTPLDGHVRVSWRDLGQRRRPPGAGPIHDESWSEFVVLGPSFSPQRDLRSAHNAVENWAKQQAL